MLLLTWIACKKPPEPPLPEPGPVTVHLVALNDFHGGLYELPVRDLEGVTFGGLPFLVSAVHALRAEDPDLIVLDGGDAFQGSWPVNATRGRGSIEAFSLLGVDAAAVGNHEFDYGPTATGAGHPKRGAFEAAAASAPYPLLTANVFGADDQRWAPANVKPWTVIERKGKRIGIVGLTTSDTPTTTLPQNVDDLTFRDVVTSVQALLPELAAANLDATVLVAHLTGGCRPSEYVQNADRCTPDGEIGRLLTELPVGTFDAMILGHAHTVLHHRVGDTFLLENRASGHLLGQLDLVIGPDGVDADASVVHAPWALVHPPVDPGCEDRPYPTEAVDVGGRPLAPNAEALALIDRLEADAGSLCDRVACATAMVSRDRQDESALGNWMTDAMRTAFPTADLAIQNSGGIRADLPAGELRREHVQRVMPFDNRTLLVELTGAQVETLFRIGTSGAHGVVQLSGGRITVREETQPGPDLDGDGEADDFERDRLCSVTVAGSPLDPTRTYRVATTDFLFTGGDHLGPAFAGARILEQGPLLRDLLFQAAEATTTCLDPAALLDPKAPRIAVGACSEAP